MLNSEIVESFSCNVYTNVDEYYTDMEEEGKRREEIYNKTLEKNKI